MSAVWERESRHERGCNVAEGDKNVGDAGLSKEVEEVEKGLLKKVGGIGERREGRKRLVGVNLDEAGEEFDTGGEEVVTDEISERGLHDGCFENGDAFPAESCSHVVSKVRGV